MARPKNLRKSGRSRNKGPTPVILGTVALCLLSVLLFAGFVWLKVRAANNVQLDARTDCPVDGPTSVTAMIFDVTDPVPQPTMDDLKNKFRQAVIQVEPGGYLWVGTFSATPGDLTSMFGHCNPGDGSTVDDLTGNSRRRQLKWEKMFEKPLQELPGKLPKDGQADQSPIMAAIQKIKTNVFDNGEFDKVPKRLIVVSDMMENTPDYSQYRSGTDWDPYKKSRAYSRYRTDLLGAEVHVLYLNRPERKFSSVGHTEFWKRWVEENNGELADFTKLEGM